MENLAAALKVLGHTERLRILVLLSHGELTVSELVQILGLSQPRITQYINSLESVGIIERLKEGSWVFSRLRRGNLTLSALIATVLNGLPKDDATLMADLRRLEDVRADRAKAANDFFASVANDRGQLGNEYLPQADIEQEMRALVGDTHFEYMVDLGTGTGRVLDVFADRITRGSGIDNNPDMLKVSRHNLASAQHTHISVRQGDINATPLDNGVADLVTLHQVLHYLDNPRDAIREAGRILRPGGTFVIVDLETHNFDEFRDLYAHRRLGFTDEDITLWMTEADISFARSSTIKTQSSRPNVKIWLGYHNDISRSAAWPVQ